MRIACGLPALALALTFAPAAALACACGCGVFDVGDGALMPTNTSNGVSLWARYSFMDQDANWEGAGGAPAADNRDKDLKTTLFTLGAQYAVSRRWTAMVELPVFDRSLTTTDDGTVFGPPGGLYTGRMTALGDLEAMAWYTGFSGDRSTGLGFGVKLPTGAWHSPLGPLGGAEFDRDTLPGTGTTDLLLGGYHVGSLDARRGLSWFVQGRFQAPLDARDGYRPGDELDAASGVAWDLGRAGPVSDFAPTLQLIGSFRARDGGPAADPANTGYGRLLIAPGFQVRLGKVRLLGSLALPVWQRFNSAPPASGNAGQLAAPALVKLQASWNF